MKAWIKVKILSDNTPLYAAENKTAAPVSYVTDHPEIEMTTAAPGYVKVKLPDGSVGFMDGDVAILQIKDMIINQDEAPLRGAASMAAPVVFTLKKGARVKMRNAAIENEGAKWIDVATPDGHGGYLEGDVKVNIITPQPRIQRERGDGKKNMAVGAAWCVGGLIVTYITYQMAENNPGGGTYFVAWGAVVFGAIQFFKGLAQSFTSDPD